MARSIRLPLVKERRQGGDRTCVLMGKLAGTVERVAFRGQTVDGVVLVKDISYTVKKQVVQVPNGFDVGLGIPAGEDAEYIGL